MTPLVEISLSVRFAFVSTFATLSVGSFVAASNVMDQHYLVATGFFIYAVIACVPMVLRDKNIGLFHPLIFMVAWWGLVRYVLPLLPVLFGGLEGHLALTGASSGELNAIAGFGFLLSSLGLASFIVGYQVVRPVYLPVPHFRKARLGAPITVVFVFVSLAALFVMAREVGGIQNLLLQRGISQQLRVEVDLGGRHWHFLAGIGVYACLVWFAFEPQRGKNPLFLVLFLISLSVMFAATGSRSLVLIPCLIIGAIWCVENKRFPIVLTKIALIGCLFLVGVGGQFRDLSRGVSEVGLEEINTSISLQVARGVENVFRYGGEVDGLFAILGNVPGKVPLLFGESYLSIGFIPIPSVFLPFEKPKAGGEIVADRIFGFSGSWCTAGERWRGIPEFSLHRYCFSLCFGSVQ